jgi:hypothetical protein
MFSLSYYRSVALNNTEEVDAIQLLWLETQTELLGLSLPQAKELRRQISGVIKYKLIWRIQENIEKNLVHDWIAARRGQILDEEYYYPYYLCYFTLPKSYSIEQLKYNLNDFELEDYYLTDC